MTGVKPGRTAIEIIAHRGMGSEFVEWAEPPENTLPAFEAAWRAGADACELDVHLTRDNEVLVIHDDSTGRTSNRDLKVSEHTLAELQMLDAGGWKGATWSGVRFPTLREVLTTIPAGRRLFIEIKTGPAIVPYVREVIRESGKAPGQLVIISFNHDSLCASKIALPELQHYFLVMFDRDKNVPQWNVTYDLTRDGSLDSQTEWQKPAATERLIQMVKSNGFDGINVSQIQPDDFFQNMHDAGLKWVVWTVDDPAPALAMAIKGAAAITTNRLLYVKKLLQSHGFQTGPAGPD